MGDNNMLPIIGLVCALSSSCTSSISLLGGGGTAFAAWRARQSGSGGGPKTSGGPTPQAPQPRVRPAPQNVGRSFKKVDRKAREAAQRRKAAATRKAREAAQRRKAAATRKSREAAQRRKAAANRKSREAAQRRKAAATRKAGEAAQRRKAAARQKARRLRWKQRRAKRKKDEAAKRAARRARIKAYKAKMAAKPRLTGCVAPNGRRNSAGEYGSPWWNTSRCTSQRAAWIQMRRSKKKKRGRPTRVSARPKSARPRRTSSKMSSAKMKAKGCVYHRRGAGRGWRCPRKKVKKIFKFKWRRRRRGGRRRRCFSPETLIKLQNGETRAMKNLELGDILINGSTVTATMQIKNESDPYYKIHSEDLNTEILVTGSHYIQSSGRFIRVSKFDGSVATQNIDPVVNCIITSDHKVPIGEYIFWDWEDQYVN